MSDVFDLEMYREIDVVYFEDEDCCTSVDNKRLFMAKKSKVTTLHIEKWRAKSPLARSQSKRFQIRCGLNLHDSSDSMVALLVPLTWDAAVAFRCCLQSSKFPLRGLAFPLPQKRDVRKSTHGFEGSNKDVRVDLNDVNIRKFLSNLKLVDEVICFLADENVPMVAHEDIRHYILAHLDWFFSKTGYILKYPLYHESSIW